MSRWTPAAPRQHLDDHGCAKMLLGAAVVCMVLASSTADAQGPGPDPLGAPGPEARALFRQANALHAKGLYAEALSRFRRAHALYPSFKIRLNIASTLHDLGRLPQAAQAYASFLKSAEKKAPPKLVKAAWSRLLALRRKLGSVRVRGTRAPAAVWLDGVKVGQTPMADPVYVRPGVHQVRVERQGFFPALQEVVLAPGEHKIIYVALETAAGKGEPAPRPADTTHRRSSSVETAARARRARLAAQVRRKRRTKTEWISLRVGGGNYGASATASLLTLRWTRFFWEMVRVSGGGGGPGRAGGYSAVYVLGGTMVGFPWSLDRDGRHELRFGLGVAGGALLETGQYVDGTVGHAKNEITGLLLQLDVSYVWHLARHFALQIGVELTVATPVGSTRGDYTVPVAGLMTGFRI